jgi:cytokinin dehydrogenase
MNDPLTDPGVMSMGVPLDGLPSLDGRVRLDAVALAEAADDFGHLVRHRPLAVLEPGSADDVAVMVRYCGERGIPVAARGRGHTTGGQAQAPGGVVVDMGTLRGIEVRGDHAVVEAGALWSELLRATLRQGRTPPVLTDYLGLSVGGTLAAGGIGGATHRYGAQVDNVTELEVVTGTGERTTCSATRRPQLFAAALSGLGQCAVITRATVRLLPAPATVRYHRLTYSSLAALTADQRTVVRDGRFDHVQGQVELDTAGPRYQLDVAAFAEAPDDAGLLGDLAYERGGERIEDLPYAGFLDRLTESAELLESLGEWGRPHPWLNVFLPGTATDAFVTSVVADLTPADLGISGVILLYPLRRSLLRAPLLRVPDEELVFLFALLRTASPGAAAPAAMVAANRAVYERVQAIGGTQYPVGTIPTTPTDWRRHYGPQWPRLAAARHRYDPAGILTPGQGVF